MFNLKPKRIIAEQLLSSWSKHQRSILLLKELPEAALQASLPIEENCTIAQQFWHIHHTRLEQLKDFIKKTRPQGYRRLGEPYG